MTVYFGKFSETIFIVCKFRDACKALMFLKFKLLKI
jgi:hypothetical protein